jgi:cytoskeletal protein RodZ
MNPKAIILEVVAVIITGLLVWYWFFFQPEVAAPVQTVEQAIEAVIEAPAAAVEVQTNPVEGKLPELNPVEKVNPFKYQNPFE